MTAGSRFDAVLFDWCGTLVEYPTRAERIRPVLECLGRPGTEDAVTDVVEAIARAEVHPDVVEAERRCDLSAADHAHAKLLCYRLAGLDDELAVAIEASYGDLGTYTSYPEVVPVIELLTDAGIAVVIVSDFHVDLRPHFAGLGVADRIGGYALSYEVGAVKPDARMFEAALTVSGAVPSRCLMVGDNPHPDGGAAALGIATLIMPLIRRARPPLLERVSALVGVG